MPNGLSAKATDGKSEIKKLKERTTVENKNKGKKKWFNAVYTVFLILLAASTIILALLKN